MNFNACNYDPGANVDSDDCDYSDPCPVDNYGGDGGMYGGDGSYGGDGGMYGGDDSNGMVYGCTDSTACNYDMDATMDSGCEYSSCNTYGGDIVGCMNFNACNYDPGANVDSDDCDYSDPCPVDNYGGDGGMYG